jgi:chemotaxis methyl-accepting protein methylase
MSAVAAFHGRRQIPSRGMKGTATLSGRYQHVVFPGEPTRRPTALDVAASSSDMLPVVEMAFSLPQENAAFLSWLFRRAGLDVHLYRPETLQRRLPACLRALRVRTPALARSLLEQAPERLATALSGMLVGVTWLFRDTAVFDLLRDHVLPELLRTRRAIHVWSVGSSDGAEVYSLALLLAQGGRLANSYLLGTDCRRDAIARARLGCFDAEALRYVPSELHSRYFTRQYDGWQALPEIRAALRWQVADITQEAGAGVWDLILCRNTAMYLRAEAASKVWGRLEALLSPGGVLVLGKAERPTGTRRLALVGPSVYRRSRG